MAVGSSATLAAGVLKAWPGLACWDAAPVGAAVFVQAPADPIRPRVVIDAPDAVSKCGTAEVSLRQSTGDGGRPWKAISWGVATAQGVAVEFIDDDTVATIAGLDPYAGQTLVVEVELTNFLDATATETAEIRVEAGSIPNVKFVGGRSFVAARHAPLVLVAEASAARCDAEAPESAKLVYEWTTNAVGAPGSEPMEFRLPEFALGPDSTDESFAVTVTVTDPSGSAGATSSTNARRPRPSPPRSAVRGPPPRARSPPRRPDAPARRRRRRR